MVAISMNWYQRISLWLRVGGIQAQNMAVASILYRCIEKIRPTDRERGEANLITRANGYEWLLPTPDYGTVTVELEADECEQLALALENLPQGATVLVADMAWILPMISQLKAGSPPKKEEKKEEALLQAA